MWTVIDVIDKSLRCSKYSGVYLVRLSDREIKSRYGSESRDVGFELCYPGPIGFGTQRVGISDVDLIRAIRECGRKREERDFIGVEYFGKSRDEMNSREIIVSDIFSRFDLCESKVRMIMSGRRKKIRLELR